MIRITIDWKDGKKFSNFIRYIENNLIYGEAQEKIRVLGHQTADHMRENIDSSKKRPDKGTQKLEKAITAETLSTTGGVEVGIGRISTLKREAPYFEVLDQGGYVPPANLGYFGSGEPPEPGKSGQDWTHTGNKKDFLMIPKKAIEGIDYIGKAIRWLDEELKNTLIKLGTKFISGVSKASK